jgi:hypothetical protein
MSLSLKHLVAATNIRLQPRLNANNATNKERSVGFDGRPKCCQALSVLGSDVTLRLMAVSAVYVFRTFLKSLLALPGTCMLCDCDGKRCIRDNIKKSALQALSFK